MPVPTDLTAPADAAARQGRPEKYERPDGMLFAAPNALWFYVFYPDHPGNWMVQDIKAGPDVPEDEVGVWWLPVLQQEPAQPGVNGHRTLKANQEPRDAYDLAHLNVNRHGGIVLPQALGYRYERDCIHPLTKAPGTRHIDAWSKPRRTLGNQRVKFDFDAQRYYRWLLGLIRDGHVPPPDPNLLDYDVARFAQRVERRQALPRTDTKVEHVADAQARLDAANTAQVPTAAVVETKRVAPKPRKSSGTA